MKKIFKSMLFLLAASTGLVLTGCSDDDDLGKMDRLFRPVLTESDNIEQGLDDNLIPYMTITWDDYTQATDYVVSVEASDGSDYQTITTDTTTHTFYNLQYDKVYNVSIRCMNSITGLESKDFTMTTTSLDYPTKLITPGTLDVIDVAARISWSEMSYDSLHIVKDSNDSLVSTIILTDEQNKDKKVVVEGLSPKTTYQVRAYINDEYLGKKRFTTTPEESFEGAVIDLREMELDADDEWKWLTTAHLQQLVDSLPDQDITIVFKGGTHYRMQNTNLPQTTGTIKLVTGLTLDGNAVFDCEGNFNVAAGVTVGGLELEKINFLDSESKKKTDSNYGGTYLMNVNTAGSYLKKLVVKSCQIKYKRGVVRGQSADFQLDDLTFDDCILDSIGGYGIAMAEAQSCIKNMTMNNTTCLNVQRTFVNTVTTAGEYNITNSTFVYCVGANRNFDDVLKCKSFSIKNCLFGQPGTTPSDLSTTFSGWAYKKDTPAETCDPVPVASDCYFTKDVIWKLDSDNIPTTQLDGKQISTDTKGTFKDPEHGDLTIQNTKELRKVGDPRWY